MNQIYYTNFTKDSHKLLSKESLSDINKLLGPRPKQWITQVILSWAIITGSILISELSDSIVLTIMAIILIATRQNVLGLLVHEQAHCLGFKAKPGHLIANLFCAYPLLVLTVENYSRVHLDHHKFFFDDSKDADLSRKSGGDWDFPMKKTKLMKLFLLDLLGINTISLILGKKSSTKTTKANKKWSRVIFYLLIAFTLTLTSTWHLFLFYWLIPLLSFFQVLVRWGAICEHHYSKDLSLEESTPLIFLKPWEKLMFPNINFNYHIYHHYFPGISFSLLPKVHDMFVKEGLVELDNSFSSAFQFGKALVYSPQITEKDSFDLIQTKEYS